MTQRGKGGQNGKKRHPLQGWGLSIIIILAEGEVKEVKVHPVSTLGASLAGDLSKNHTLSHPHSENPEDDHNGDRTELGQSQCLHFGGQENSPHKK